MADSVMTCEAIARGVQIAKDFGNLQVLSFTSFTDMTDFAIPLYSKNKVDRAAQNLIKRSDWRTDSGCAAEAEIVSNWRAAHAYPLLAFNMGLRAVMQKGYPEAIIAQRLKRMISIERKLRANPTMKLSQMQDIGGCRVVLPTIKDVYEMQEMYLKGRHKHVLVRTTDYIKQPKKDGYRSLHLMYQYKGNSNTKNYDDLRIEIQFRSQLQHLWATAVETVDAFTEQTLKWSGGRDEWKKFFVLTGTAFELREKNMSAVEISTTMKAVRTDLIALDKKHKISSAFQGFRVAVQHFTDQEKMKKDSYCLLTFIPLENTIEVQVFKRSESINANIAYTKAEQSIAGEQGKNVVLVSVASLQLLKRAYPNYFMDTANFMEEIKDLLAPTIIAKAAKSK